MSQTPTPTTPEPGSVDRIGRVELMVSYILRGGVILSFLIVLVGMILTFHHHREYLSSRDVLATILNGRAGQPHSVSAVLASAKHWEGRGWILFGVLVLILTPVFRVVVALVAFAIEKDRHFIVLSAIVLILLLTSFFLGYVTN